MIAHHPAIEPRTQEVAWATAAMIDRRRNGVNNSMDEWLMAFLSKVFIVV